MNSTTRTEILKILIKNYFYEQENSKIWMREESSSYLISLGKLSGFCMAYEFIIDETPDVITIYTKNKRQVICKVLKKEAI